MRQHFIHPFLEKLTLYAEVPPRVEYELTQIGYELGPVIRQLESWGQKHKDLMVQKPV